MIHVVAFLLLNLWEDTIVGIVLQWQQGYNPPAVVFCLWQHWLYSQYSLAVFVLWNYCLVPRLVNTCCCFFLSVFTSLDCLTASSLCRTQSLEKVLVLLQDEIHKLEHNDTVLKDMEKDLSVHHCLFIRLAVLSLSYCLWKCVHLKNTVTVFDLDPHLLLVLGFLWRRHPGKSRVWRSTLIKSKKTGGKISDWVCLQEQYQDIACLDTLQSHTNGSKTTGWDFFIYKKKKKGLHSHLFFSAEIKRR